MCSACRSTRVEANIRLLDKIERQIAQLVLLDVAKKLMRLR